MIVFGIDPGSKATGLAVIERNLETNSSQLLALDCYESKSSWSFDKKILFMGEKILLSLKEFNPDSIALEDIFVGKNTQSSFRLAELRGVVRFLASQEAVNLESVPAKKVKKAITGNGNASKALVAELLAREYSFDLKNVPEDATDALALAVYIGLHKNISGVAPELASV